MGSENLTIGKALKFARHDFLNELQLMLLYMDLGKTPEARKTLLEATERMHHMSTLENLRMPETELWLSTFDWRHTVFSKTVKCTILAGDRMVDDSEVANYLEQLMSTIGKEVDPMGEYNVDVLVNASTEEWEIQLTIQGSLAGISRVFQVSKGFQVCETLQDEQWTFTISGR